jgi:hypothetical protein
VPARIILNNAWSMAARVPANRKSAAENTAPSGIAEMSWYIASVVRMSEIMHIFQNFSSNPNFGCTHCIH